MSLTKLAKRNAESLLRQQAEDLLEVVIKAYRAGFYGDAARATQHLKHVLECLDQNEAAQP